MPKSAEEGVFVCVMASKTFGVCSYDDHAGDLRWFVGIAVFEESSWPLLAFVEIGLDRIEDQLSHNLLLGDP